MKYRRLGKTNLEVSEVGLGGAGIGHAWGAITDEECVRTVERAPVSYTHLTLPTSDLV